MSVERIPAQAQAATPAPAQAAAPVPVPSPAPSPAPASASSHTSSRPKPKPAPKSKSKRESESQALSASPSPSAKRAKTASASASAGATRKRSANAPISNSQSAKRKRTSPSPSTSTPSPTSSAKNKNIKRTRPVGVTSSSHQSRSTSPDSVSESESESESGSVFELESSSDDSDSSASRWSPSSPQSQSRSMSRSASRARASSHKSKRTSPTRGNPKSKSKSKSKSKPKSASAPKSSSSTSTKTEAMPSKSGNKSSNQPKQPKQRESSTKSKQVGKPKASVKPKAKAPKPGYVLVSETESESESESEHEPGQTETQPQTQSSAHSSRRKQRGAAAATAPQESERERKRVERQVQQIELAAAKRANKQRLQQAAASKEKDCIDWSSVNGIPECPTLRPTISEFSDAVAYLRTITPLYSAYGIVRIIPPAGWKRPHTYPFQDPNLQFTVKTQKVQRIHSHHTLHGQTQHIPTNQTPPQQLQQPKPQTQTQTQAHAAQPHSIPSVATHQATPEAPSLTSAALTQFIPAGGEVSTATSTSAPACVTTTSTAAAETQPVPVRVSPPAVTSAPAAAQAPAPATTSHACKSHSKHHAKKHICPAKTQISSLPLKERLNMPDFLRMAAREEKRWIKYWAAHNTIPEPPSLALAPTGAASAAVPVVKHEPLPASTTASTSTSTSTAPISITTPSDPSSTTCHALESPAAAASAMSTNVSLMRGPISSPSMPSAMSLSLPLSASTPPLTGVAVSSPSHSRSGSESQLPTLSLEIPSGQTAYRAARRGSNSSVGSASSLSAGTGTGTATAGGSGAGAGAGAASGVPRPRRRTSRGVRMTPVKRSLVGQLHSPSSTSHAERDTIARFMCALDLQDPNIAEQHYWHWIASGKQPHTFYASDVDVEAAYVQALEHTEPRDMPSITSPVELPISYRRVRYVPPVKPELADQDDGDEDGDGDADADGDGDGDSTKSDMNASPKAGPTPASASAPSTSTSTSCDVQLHIPPTSNGGRAPSPSHPSPSPSPNPSPSSSPTAAAAAIHAARMEAAARQLARLPTRKTDWDLLLLARLPNMVLRHLKEPIPGVTDPMLYIGLLFSTFCWHNEDNFMYSVSYHHKGMPKTWYGVPGDSAEALEQLCRDMIYPDLDKKLHNVLPLKTSMFNPHILRAHGIPVYKALQHEDAFIVTFPRAYHAGFSHGFSLAESVNFCLEDWFPYSVNSMKQYELDQRFPVIPHEELILRAVRNCIHIHIHRQANGNGNGNGNGHALVPWNTPVTGPYYDPLVSDVPFLKEILAAFSQLLQTQRTLRTSVASVLRFECDDEYWYKPQPDTSYHCKHCKHACYIAKVVCWQCVNMYDLHGSAVLCLSCASQRSLVCMNHREIHDVIQFMCKLSIPQMEQIQRALVEKLENPTKMISVTLEAMPFRPDRQHTHDKYEDFNACSRILHTTVGPGRSMILTAANTKPPPTPQQAHELPADNLQEAHSAQHTSTSTSTSTVGIPTSNIADPLDSANNAAANAHADAAASMDMEPVPSSMTSSAGPNAHLHLDLDPESNVNCTARTTDTTEPPPSPISTLVHVDWAPAEDVARKPNPVSGHQPPMETT